MQRSIAGARESRKGARRGLPRLAAMPSSVIRRWDYDDAAQRLDVEFVTGKLYSYHEVPPRIVEEMRAAFSKGSYFNREIRDHFRFTRQRAPRS